MAMNFTFVGKLKAVKDNEKFKGYEVRTFESGWVQTNLKFNATNGNNRHIFQIKAGYWGDKNGNVNEDKTVIYAPVTDEETHKTTRTKIAYVDREDEDVLKSVSKGGKYILDLRTDENPAGYKEYIFEKDFIDDVKKHILENTRVSDVRFRVLGEVEITYSESKGNFYKTFVPKRIYLAKDTEEDKMQINAKLIYGRTSLEDVAGTDNFVLNAYSRYYDNSYRGDNCKGYCFCPVEVNIVPKNEKQKDLFVKRFREFETDSSEYREIGMVIDVIDGQEIVRVTEDMLGEEAKENIEYGFSTLEEELKKAGGTTYGPRITEYRFNNWGSPSEDTVYQDEDLLPPHHDDEEKSDDIFEDDEI